MIRLFRHLRHWYRWQKKSANGWKVKLMVLFKIIESPTWWMVPDGDL